MFAYCMPRASCLPPGPFLPEAGSNTPIFTTSPLVAAASLLAAAELLLEELPQPAFFGVYDLATRLVGVPGAAGSPHGLQPAPSTSAELRRVLANAATGISLD